MSVASNESTLNPRGSFDGLRVFVERREALFVGAASVFFVLVLWQVASGLGWLDPTFVSSPIAVIRDGIQELTGEIFWSNAYLTFSAVFYGFTVATTAGILAGLILKQFPILEDLSELLIWILYTTPRSALIPLVVVAAGIGIYANSVIVFLGVFFPVLINTRAGLESVDPTLVRAARSFGATQRDIFMKIWIPSSIPYIVTGVRLGIGRALSGVIIAEMYVSIGGIGFLLNRAGLALRADTIWFLAILMGGVGFAAVAALAALERRIAPWRSEAQR